MPNFLYKQCSIFYEDKGSGDCLFYVHEWNNSSLIFRRFTLRHLENEARVICIDLPGYGHSGYPDDLKFDDFAMILAGVMDHLEIRKCSFMGFCLGSGLILDFYRKFPERVNHMILIEPMIKFPGILIPLLIPWFGKAFLKSLKRSYFLFALTGHRIIGGGKPVRNIVFKSIGKSDPVISRHYLKLLYEKHHIDPLPAGHNPGTGKTICIMGQNTNRLFKANARFLMKHFDISEWVILEDTRHFILTEQPVQVSNIILNFLKPAGIFKMPGIQENQLNKMQEDKIRLKFSGHPVKVKKI